jgi:DNA-binding CsgD family transcriptional regulator
MMTASAFQWMAEYFEPPRRAPRLPEELERWVQHQLAQLNGDEPSRPLDSLVIDRDGKRLVVRLILQPAGDPYLLLAEQKPASPRLLERLGLSRRRAEGLFWVAQGKTDEEVARILGCTVGTARKHLQRIFEQLGVGNRHAATLRALDILGLPDKAGL